MQKILLYSAILCNHYNWVRIIRVLDSIKKLHMNNIGVFNSVEIYNLFTHSFGFKNIYFIILVSKIFHHFGCNNISSLWSQKYFITLVTNIFYHLVSKIFHHLGPRSISSFLIILITKLFNHFDHKNISSF